MAESRRHAEVTGSLKSGLARSVPVSGRPATDIQAILELQRAAGNAAVADLLEGVPEVQRQAGAPALPADMTAPYHPGDLSRRYWAMPPAERSKINTQTDSDFASRSGIARRLNRKNPADLPAVRMWLRIRDAEVAKTVSAAAAPPAAAPATTTFAPPIDLDELSKLIAKHKTVKFLDEAGLAKDLATHLPADPYFVMTVIQNLYFSHQKDGTSVELGKLLGDDDLVGIASSPAGRSLLLEMVSAMQGVTTSADDKKQAQRMMHAMSKARIASGRRVEIEVLTFRWGGAVLDAAGQYLFGKGAKGHTAVVAGGIAYSFDARGWVVAGTKEEYLAQNTFRDAIGQVIDVPEEDAEKVQSALDDSVGTMTYLLNKGNHVCTDETARALEAALGKLDSKHSPQEFAKVLAATGKIRQTNNYPKKK